MNKAQLVAAMAENAGMTKKDAEKALAAFEEVVTTSLQKGEKIHYDDGVVKEPTVSGRYELYFEK